MAADPDRSTRQPVEERDRAVDLDEGESERPQTIRLDREQLLKDLRETQDLSLKKTPGSSDRRDD